MFCKAGWFVAQELGQRMLSNPGVKEQPGEEGKGQQQVESAFRSRAAVSVALQLSKNIETTVAI